MHLVAEADILLFPPDSRLRVKVSRWFDRSALEHSVCIGMTSPCDGFDTLGYSIGGPVAGADVCVFQAARLGCANGV